MKAEQPDISSVECICGAQIVPTENDETTWVHVTTGSGFCYEDDNECLAEPV
jgi:hypothetical protein